MKKQDWQKENTVVYCDRGQTAITPEKSDGGIQKCLLETQKGTTAHVDDLAVFQELRRRNAIIPHK